MVVGAELSHPASYRKEWLRATRPPSRDEGAERRPNSPATPLDLDQRPAFAPTSRRLIAVMQPLFREVGRNSGTNSRRVRPSVPTNRLELEMNQLVALANQPKQLNIYIHSLNSFITCTVHYSRDNLTHNTFFVKIFGGTKF